MKQIATNYTLNGAAVTLTGVNVPLSSILLVSNATTGAVLYSIAGPAAAGYTQAASSVITLASAPASTDKLHISYDDGVSASGANSSLSNIDSDLGAPADAAATTDTGTFSIISLLKRLLQKSTVTLGSGGVDSTTQRVTLANDQTVAITNTSLGNIDSNLGNVADAPASADTGSFSLIALTKRLLTRFSTLLTTFPQQTSYTGTLASSLSIGAVAAGPYDCAGFNTAVLTGSALGGSLQVDLSYDGGTTWVGGVLGYAGSNLVTQPIAASSINSTYNQVRYPIAGANKIRIFAPGGASSGSAFALALSNAYQPAIPGVVGLNAGSNTIGNVGLTAGTNNIGSINLALNSTPLSGAPNDLGSAARLPVIAVNPANLTDISSAGRTTSGSGTAGTVSYTGNYSALVNVTSATGTNQTLDLVLQESYDNGTTFQDIYHLPRITAAGTWRVPCLPTSGKRRWVWTIGGTSPNISFSVLAQAGTPNSAVVQRQYFDRTSGLLSGTSAATSATFDVAGCKNLTATVVLGAATTPATYQIQVSPDGSNWASVGTATAAVANSTVTFGITSNAAPYARVAVTFAATGQTGTFVTLNGTN
jgi:hypothetical protein